MQIDLIFARKRRFPVTPTLTLAHVYGVMSGNMKSNTCMCTAENPMLCYHSGFKLIEIYHLAALFVRFDAGRLFRMRELCLNRTCNPTANASNIVAHMMLNMSKIHTYDHTQSATAVSFRVRDCRMISRELTNGMSVGQAPSSKTVVHCHSIAK
jgi:hypothetical protein